MKALLLSPLSLLTLALLAPSSLAAPFDYVGTWKNADGNTRGITRLVFSPQPDGNVRLQAFGKCSPSDCDWGTVPTVGYGRTVSDFNANRLSAVFENGFSKTTLIVDWQGATLHLISLTQFLDGSKRSNSYDLGTFRR